MPAKNQVHGSDLSCAIREAKDDFAADPLLSEPWQEWCDRLNLVYFEGNHDAMVGSAYYTFCRTLRRYTKICSERVREQLRRKSSEILRSQITAISNAAHQSDRHTFDRWHRSTCTTLRDAWAPHFALSWGQAQKWLNILTKYYVALGDEGAHPGLRKHWLDALHTPLDASAVL